MALNWRANVEQNIGNESNTRPVQVIDSPKRVASRLDRDKSDKNLDDWGNLRVVDEDQFKVQWAKSGRGEAS